MPQPRRGQRTTIKHCTPCVSRRLVASVHPPTWTPFSIRHLSPRAPLQTPARSASISRPLHSARLYSRPAARISRVPTPEGSLHGALMSLVQRFSFASSLDCPKGIPSFAPFLSHMRHLTLKTMPISQV
ncbi:hypothetical protein C8R44DRAFT_399194 [Mycena epipterygia]|nr:hypothetical protein C8R44DRAFT_399194 [Mycena epipterygia]